MESRLLLATFVVNTATDPTSPVAGLLSLREAIAMSNLPHSGADNIDFAIPASTSRNLDIPVAASTRFPRPGKSPWTRRTALCRRSCTR